MTKAYFLFDGIEKQSISIDKINNISKNIINCSIVFNKNGAILLIIPYSYKIDKKNDLYIFKGKYLDYYYTGIAKTNDFTNGETPETIRIILDYIYFSQSIDFNIKDDTKLDVEIIAPNIYNRFLKENKFNIEKNLFFKKIAWSEYLKKYINYFDMITMIHNQPIQINYTKLKYNKKIAFFYHSHNINDNIRDKDTKNYYIYNGFKNYNIKQYINNFNSFYTDISTFNKLLIIYLLTDIQKNKISYYLNDIAGYVDLLDAIYYKLNGKKEKITYCCKNCKNETNQPKEPILSKKINYILEKLEISYKNNTLISEQLAQFRNSIRHQKDFNMQLIDKIGLFSKLILIIYFLKCILKVNNDDYNFIKLQKNYFTFMEKAHE